MSKGNNITVQPDLHSRPSKKERVVSMTLITCRWKKEFTVHECKVMIAEALNYCVYHHHMKIAGYLITGRRLCLVLQIDPQQADEMLRHFYKELRKEILLRLQRRSRIEEQLQQLTEAESEKYSPLFIKIPLQNYMLLRLITGRRMELPYYSPYLARLENRISHENFCSAVDYTGAKGPVVVKLLKAGEFDK